MNMTKQNPMILKDTGTHVAPSCGQILEKIKKKIEVAQAKAMSSANRELILVYRELGKMIHEQHQKAY